MRGQGKSELMCDTWKKQNCHSEYTYFISFNKCMWLMIPVSNQLLYKKSGTYLFQDWTDKEQISSSVQTNVCTHILCHFVLATEIGCLCEDDSLSFLSQRLIVFKCFRKSVLVYAQQPMSYPLTPLDAARVKTQYFIYSVSFPHWSLSQSLCLCLTLIPLLFLKKFFLKAQIYPWSKRDIQCHFLKAFKQKEINLYLDKSEFCHSS